MGKLLFCAAEDKIIYGRRGPVTPASGRCAQVIGLPDHEDRCAGYGYPQLNDQAKRKTSARRALLACTAWTSPTRGPGRQRSPRGRSSGGKHGSDGGRAAAGIAAVPTEGL